MLLLVPIQIDPRNFGAGPIFGDGIIILEDITKVMGVVFTNIFNTKAIYNEIESDRAPFVAPEARGGDCLVVTSSIYEIGKEVIGELARFHKAKEAFAYLEVYSPVTRKLMEIIFTNKSLWDIQQENTCVFAAIKGGAQVEVRYAE